MYVLHRKELVLGTILLLTAGYCAGVAKRDTSEQDAEDNDLNLEELPNLLAKIPEIGPTLRDALNYVGETLMIGSQLLNSIIGRLLGGSLPCELGPTNVTCSGVSTEGGVFGIVEDLVDQLLVPDILKTLLVNVIKRTINPIASALFGGEPLPTETL